jgi:hypothetical protein
MRMLTVVAAFGLLLPLAAPAQDAFDACEVLTAADAEKALGTAAAGEPVSPKARRPKVVAACTYTGFKDGKAVAARAQFRFARNEGEAERAFEEARMQLQTKPMLMRGAEAFWSGKTGEMHVRKGRTTVTISAGPAAANERDLEAARKLAEAIAKKL